MNPGTTWGKPPSAVPRAQLASITGAEKDNSVTSVAKAFSDWGQFCSVEKCCPTQILTSRFIPTAELRSAGQPRAAVPTRSLLRKTNFAH